MYKAYCYETLTTILNKLKVLYKDQTEIVVSSYTINELFPQYTQKHIISILSRNKYLLSNRQVREPRPSRKLLYHEYLIKI
jgi:hypothetical protein